MKSDLCNAHSAWILPSAVLRLGSSSPRAQHARYRAELKPFVEALLLGGSEKHIIRFDHLNTSAAGVESKLHQPARTRTSVRPHRERNWPWSFLESFCRRGRESPAYSE